MQGWHYGKGLIYYRLIFRLTKLTFLSRIRAIPREKKSLLLDDMRENILSQKAS